MADQTIAWMQRQKSILPEKPWIAYYAPSGHKPPVGVPSEFIEKYRGQFDDGYDQLRDDILFAYDGGGIGKGGTGTLSVNGKQVGDGRIDKTVPFVFSTDDTFDVGEDWGTPVSPTYQPPFPFTGALKWVTVEASGASDDQGTPTGIPDA